MSTYLLDLTFFQNRIDNSFKTLINGQLVHTASGRDFLFITDDQNNIFKVNHHFQMQVMSTKLDSIDYLAASQTNQQVLAASKFENGYNIIYENVDNFADLDGGCTCITGKEIKLANRSKAGNEASLFTASSELNYIAYKTSENECLIYKAPFNEKSKPCQQFILNEDVEKILITEKGTIFLISENKIKYYNLGTKNLMVLDEQGCKKEFAFLNKNGLVVCRDRILTIYKINNDNEINKDILDITSESTEQPEMIGAIGTYIYMIYSYNIAGSSQRIKVIDPTYKLRVFQQNLSKKAMFVEIQWGALVLILSDKSVLMFSEVENQTKVDRLCKKNRFQYAIQISNELNLGADTIANIHKLQGDYFYDSAKFEDSINEYIETIGFIEPSHVIQKFVEPHHAQNLMKYLNALQEKKLATKQHTTLLFNCYTKIRATGLLEQAVDKFVEAAKNGEEPNFDVETAVDVLKRNNYPKQAENLARAYKQYNLLLQLLYENQNYKGILDYLEQLHGEIIKKTLIEYGSEIMDNYEEGRQRLTKFAVKCCTEGIDNKNNKTEKVIHPNDLSIIFVNNNEMYFDFLYQIFQSKPDELDDTIWNILIEMSIRAKSDKVMELLKFENAKYSNEQALVYLNAFGHTEGKIYVYEKMGLYTLILQESPPEKSLEICLKYGDKDPTLWCDALVKLSNSECDNQLLTNFLDELLKHDALPFLTILKIIKNAKKSFSTILPIVQTVFQREQDLLHQAENKINECNKKAEKNKSIVQTLSTQNFVINQSKCAICNLDIDSESNHFMCGHSFHLDCLGDSSDFCPLCKDGYEKIIEDKIQKLKSASEKTNVDQQLKSMDDGFQFLLDQVELSLFSSGIDLTSSKQQNDDLNEAQELLQKMSPNINQ